MPSLTDAARIDRNTMKSSFSNFPPAGSFIFRSKNLRDLLAQDSRLWSMLGCCFAMLGPSAWQLSAQVPPDSPRMTPLVKVIADIEPAVVSLFVPVGGDRQGFGSGSGTIIHPAGYVLTNNHVLPGTEGFALIEGKPMRFAVVGRLPEKDIAVVRLLDSRTSFPTIPLGHSHDVMKGESVVVAGNPGGRGVVFTSGIVSSNRLIISAPNALVMTQFPNSRRDVFLQFDAASNRGNSGGPLVNMEGELIGVVSALIPQEQNVGFAIPVDRVRELFERTLEPELIYQKSTGVRLHPAADGAIIAEVAPDSAAAKAGLQTGDTLVAFGGDQPRHAAKLRHAVDWIISLHRMLPSGNPMELIVRRGDDEFPIKMRPDAKPPLTPVDATETEPGLAFKFYHGQFAVLPDFEKLEPVREGVVAEIDIDQIRGDRDDKFAISLDGLIRIEQDGLYRLTVISDDGSRVYLHGDLFIDHDGNHPPTPASRLLRADAGLHPIRVEHFEGLSHQALELKLQQVSGESDEEMKLEFFHQE